MEKLFEYFNSHIALNTDDLAFIKKNAIIKNIPKNQVILLEGDVSREFYFIINGSMRLFYLSEGEEKTAYFYTENTFVSSYESFTKQTPAKHNLATIEDSTLVVFTLESVGRFLNYSPKFDLLARIIMEEELSTYQHIISSFITKNAEQRYIQLLHESPELVKRIPQHQIATFIGVAPETLSRIRKRIVAK